MIFFAKNRFRSKTVSYELSDNSVLGDYHFWYQTYDGRWANKHGKGGLPELLPIDETPFSNDTSRWNYSNYDNFYDKGTMIYIIALS